MRAPKPHVIIVLGMHRGGTSAVARGLEVIGVNLGDNLLPAGDDNPKGFWEDVECIALNEELLAQAGSGYDRLGLAWRFSEPNPAISALKLRAIQVVKRKLSEHSGLWGFKDPRTSRLVPFWREVIETCGGAVSFVIALRNPLSVAVSFEKRNQIPAEKSYFLWLQHMLPAVLETVGSRRAVTDYDLLLEQPGEQLRRIASRLGLDFDEDARAGLETYQKDFLEPKLRHSEFAAADLAIDSRVPGDVVTLYGLLSDAARDQIDLDAPGVMEQFREIDSRLRAFASAFQYANALEDDRTRLYLAVGERDARIESLGPRLLERDARVAGLKRTISEREEQIAALRHAMTDRDNRLTRLEQVLAERGKQIASIGRTLSEREEQIASLTRSVDQRGDKVDSLKAVLSDREALIDSQQRAFASLKQSLSWRVTGPLRAAYDVWLKLRESPAEPRPHRQMPEPARSRPEAPAPPRRAANHSTPRDAKGPGATEYVEDSPPPPHFVPGARLVAFYLPQFHAIPENDAWWGKGFTEWTNVTGAAPQFRGHYQPHLPGELGFYDLRVKDTQARQVELAKRYGIGAFCFYSYWFGGKRLLELPVRQYLDNPQLDLPFCLCWANENWTRRWDGLDEEVLIAQNHSPADDLAFIEHVAEYMRDRRYLRVNGRPVLLVYRPALLPDVKATVQRWREWARRNGLGELYLVYPQSFETVDPAEYGFDAATEFPPNLSGPPVLTDSVELLNPDFSGIVYDWRILVERSRKYAAPAYKLFRGVCPSWDSEPRRAGRGTAFVNSTPEAYGEWLENAVADTRQRLNGDERLIFVNAWNEWAEGAHLEPDRRYGYAWLRATRDALQTPTTTAASVQGRVVVVTHDAHPHGGQYIALNIVKKLASALHCEVETVCLGDGPLKSEFARHGRLHELFGKDAQGPEARALAGDLFQRGFRHAIVNTTASGLFLETLKQAGFSCVALVHELREVIVSYKLQAHARTLAEHADYVVFPAAEVRDAFAEFATIPAERAIVRPQGLLKRNGYAPGNLDAARRALREELGLPADALIVLAVAYADRRKGVDYFVDITARMVEQDPRLHFAWVGHGEGDAQSLLAARAKHNPGLTQHVHFVGRRDDTDMYYAGADVFALTSREDPFPCVLLEAMDVGLPMVGFDGSGGGNRLIAEAGGENVPMGDVAAFAAAIQTLLGDAARRQGIAGLGPALIASRFSLRQYAFDLLALTGTALRKVSVVLPNYNYERYLPDRIATILNQTYPIYELIFLDDASRDNSVAVATGLLAGADIDYRFATNRANSGSVFRQWKLGAELARGDVIWIAEADDLSHPDFLATVLHGFEDPEVVLSYCESKQIDREGHVLADNYHDYIADLGKDRWKRRYINAGEDEIRQYMAVKNTIPNVSAVVMKRAELTRVLAEHIEDICSYKVAGDWKTYLHLLPRARLAYAPQPLNMHRRHHQGVTIGSFNEAHFREIQDIQKWVAGRYVLGPRVSAAMRRYLEVLREQFGVSLDEAIAVREMARE